MFGSVRLQADSRHTSWKLESPAWKDPEGTKLGWMRAFTINGKEYVLTEL